MSKWEFDPDLEIEVLDPDWDSYFDPYDHWAGLDGETRLHRVVREEQPMIPRHGWTMGSVGGDIYHIPDLPRNLRYTEFDREVHEARLILIELGRILDS